MSVEVCLAGDTMLGRGVARTFRDAAPPVLFAPELRAEIQKADLRVFNLECCISSRGARWQARDKRFFFRAPPEAATALADIGVNCVTLANNHALDYGREALLDTLEALDRAGVRAVGAGADIRRAREPVILASGAFRLAVVAISDHPADYAATPTEPGIAFADLRAGVPPWLTELLRSARSRADALLVSPHWGPNLSLRPPRHVRAAASALRDAATLIAGHSAHAFHGVRGNVLFDLGDLINDYASESGTGPLLRGSVQKVRAALTGVAGDAAASVGRRSAGTDPQLSASFARKLRWRAISLVRMVRARRLRSDLGMLFFATIDGGRLRRVEALPIKLERCHTRIASGAEADRAHRRFRSDCAALGTSVQREGGRSVITL